jgi:peptidoglycan-associated lipoprotein
MNKFIRNASITSVTLVMLLTGCSNKGNVFIDDKYNTKGTSYSQNGTGSTIDTVDTYTHSITSVIDSKEIALKSVHFDFDKYNLTETGIETTKNNYALVKDVINSGNAKLKVEGNCDEWGTDEYNYALGLKRAKTVKEALVNDGIPEDKIVMVSFGESNPICTDKSKSCWKKNRRVDHLLLP